MNQKDSEDKKTKFECPTCNYKGNKLYHAWCPGVICYLCGQPTKRFCKLCNEPTCVHCEGIAWSLEGITTCLKCLPIEDRYKVKA